MPNEIVVSLATVQSFVLALSRVGGLFVFVPLPGVRTGPGIVRTALSIALTLTLFSRWPDTSGLRPEMGQLILWSLSEVALGVTVGLLVSFLTEMLAFGAQAISLPAGYTYASSIDPSTQAESNILVIMAQLVSGLLFFAFNFHHQLVLALAKSFEVYPPGTFTLSESTAQLVVRAGSSMFSVGLGLMLPVLGLLAMIDISLALLGRLNAQVQVLTVSFPLKMLATLVVLTVLLTSVIPRVFQRFGNEMLSLVWSLVTP